MRSLASVLLLLLLMPSLSLAQTKSVDFLYRAKLPLSSETSTFVQLSPNLDRFISTDYNNFAVLDDENNAISFQLETPRSGRVDNVGLVETIPALPGQAIGNLVDDDPFTSFEFPDSDITSALVISLDQPLLVHQMRLDIPESTELNEVIIRTGFTSSNLQTSYRSNKSERIINLPTDTPVQYLEILLNGKNIVIEDIVLFQPTRTNLLIEPIDSDRPAYLYYGNLNDSGITYANRVVNFAPELLADSTKTWLTQTSVNPLSREDFDNDGINNTNDNCPLDSNNNQADTDNDKFGDVCDTLPERKNQNQSDLDKDGIGDVGDNCRVTPNPDQTDLDQDGIGDVCDVAENPVEITQKIKYLSQYSWAIGSGLILLFFAFVLFRRQK